MFFPARGRTLTFTAGTQTMAKRRWTVVFVPHGSEPSKIVEVSYAALKVVAGFGVLTVLLLLLVGGATVSRSVDISRATRLEAENARLNARLADLDGRLEALADTLDHLAQRDAQVRLLANLEPIDPQVRAAGIGGPGAGEPAGARPDVNAMLRRASLLAHSFRETADSLRSHGERLAAVPSILPTRGWLTSAFSRNRLHPVLQVRRAHEGIDVTAPKGTPIEAAGAGVVREAGTAAGFGLQVVIDHGYGIRTRYAHASRLLVRPGQRVKRGTPIALVGSTGLASGPHLHYEVHVNGRPVDPLHYVLPEAITD